MRMRIPEGMKYGVWLLWNLPWIVSLLLVIFGLLLAMKVTGAGADWE